jgi:methylmalonyl-CoA mutase C-terminal domain/subunit
MEVIYTGLHQTPSRSSRPTCRRTPTASGLSVLSGAHMTLFAKVMSLLKERRRDDVVVFGGGIIPSTTSRSWRSSASHDLHARGDDAVDRRLGPRARGLRRSCVAPRPA